MGGVRMITRSWVKFACAHHVHGIVYQLLEIGDAAIAVCLHPPRDARVSQGVEWLE